MNRTIDRRTFLERSTLAGAGAIVSTWIPGVLRGSPVTGPNATICAVAGDRIFENTVAAVDALGGMKRFVKQGQSVALLINSVFDRPGTYVNPDIALAVVKMCLDAGAKSIVTLERTPDLYLVRGTAAGKLSREIGLIGRSSGRTDVKTGKGKIISEASVSPALLSADVFINIPIIKDHRGVLYTGNLKNMMGACSSSTCQRCHFGDSSFLAGVFKGYYSKPDVLAQSIADLNLLRSPDLSVTDVTEILTTNGPAGPGKLKSPMLVVAGTNALAVDMYCISHLGLDPGEILTIQRAQDHALGPRSLKEVRLLAR